MRFILGFLLGFLLACFPIDAGTINTPPPLSNTEVALQHYLLDIRNNMNKPNVLTTTPDGNRKGLIGQIVSFNDSGTFHLYVNVDGSKSWQEFTQL